jgi:hypothetical protein
LWGAAHRDPDGELLLQGPRVDGSVVERRSMPPGPGHPLGVPNQEEKLQLLGEKLVIVIEVVSEKGK